MERKSELTKALLGEKFKELVDVYKRQQRDSFPFLPYVIAYSNDSIVEA